jgi:magnesium transporter
MKILSCLPNENACLIASLDEAVRLINERPDALVWIDFDSPFTAEQLSMLSQAPFGFHELSLEDASKEDGQRPKAEAYDNHFFLVMHAVKANMAEGRLFFEWNEIDIFGGSNFLVSVHRKELPEVSRLWDSAGSRREILSNGSDKLAYYLLDSVVDGYLEAVEDMEDFLDAIEDLIINGSGEEQPQQKIFYFKRQLTDFRRKGIFLREPVNEIMSRAFPFVRDETLVYFRDVYDHLIRISDMLDTYRDTLTTALDVHLSTVSNKLKQIMKRLTVLATIFMPLTFLTGFFGMNFTDLPFDRLDAFVGSIVLMVASTVIMLVLFQTRGYK